MDNHHPAWVFVKSIAGIASSIPVEQGMKRPTAASLSMTLEPVSPEVNGVTEEAPAITETPRRIEFAKPTNDDTLEHQRREMIKEMILMEAHLRQGSRINNLPCDCTSKHSIAIEALAEETIGIDPSNARVYSELAEFAREIQSKGSQEVVASGKYDEEYPVLAERARVFRKQLMGG